MTDRLRRGNFVRIRLEGSDDEWTSAFVGLASETNPSSVMLVLNGGVRARDGFIIGGLPVTIDYEKETVTGLTGDAYEIEVTR